MLEDRPPDVRIAQAGHRSVGDAARGSGHRSRRPRTTSASTGSISCTRCAAAPRRWCRSPIARSRARRSTAGTRCTSRISTCSRATSSPTTSARAISTRGTRPNEARSDIFFLEVKPFEQEFALAQSQAACPAAASGSIDDLVTAQKEIVVATWKLDRRGAERQRREVGAGHQVGRARRRAELKTRVEQTVERVPRVDHARSAPAAAAARPRTAAAAPHARAEGRRDAARRRRHDRGGQRDGQGRRRRSTR